MSDTQHSSSRLGPAIGVDAGPADLSALPPAERAARYRELAKMHLGFAGRAAIADARAAHLELAALWTRLAAQADHESARARAPDGAPITDPRRIGL